ncbi:MAG TPA: molecular chaperone DnaJ [Actinomycetaceae bacterium]|nr:molecular chaperone DnaJ [Actinomycetaceae bacterium]
MSDYYEVLGVQRDATQAEIKKAYLKLARETHPDVAGPGSEERFKEASTAYEVLADQERRRMYDLGGPDALRNGGASPFGAGGFQDIFETFFGSAPTGTTQRGPVPRGRRGQDALVPLEITLKDVIFGGTKNVTVNTAVVCPTCNGTACRPGTSPVTCAACNGRGSVQRVARSFLGQIMTTSPCANCQGHGTIIMDPCPECSGDGRVRTKAGIPVDIPAGVEHGQRLRMPGHGEVGPGAGPAGDLHIEFRVKADPTFARRGDDLICSISVPTTAAALGTRVVIETFDGAQEVNVPAGTQPGHTEVLKGLGVTRLGNRSRGDLKVFVDVEVPTKLDERQRELIAELARIRGEERVEPNVTAGGGLFARLRERIGL